jgi:hypothetical protein
MRPDLRHYTDALHGVRATLRARARRGGGGPSGSGPRGSGGPPRESTVPGDTVSPPAGTENAEGGE